MGNNRLIWSLNSRAFKIIWLRHFQYLRNWGYLKMYSCYHFHFELFLEIFSVFSWIFSAFEILCLGCPPFRVRRREKHFHHNWSLHKSQVASDVAAACITSVGQPPQRPGGAEQGAPEHLGGAMLPLFARWFPLCRVTFCQVVPLCVGTRQGTG